MKELPFKGFIFPDGKIITPEVTLSHEGMAFNYIRDYGFMDKYKNSEHSSAQDFLVYELNAMQVRTGGEKILILLVENYKYFSSYIREYQQTDSTWKVLMLSSGRYSHKKDMQ